MTELTGPAWALLVVGALVVGVSKTALPGSATLAVVIFAAILPARSSTAALLLLLIVGDVMALAIYRRHADWRALVRLAPSVTAGIVVGALFLAWADDQVVRRAIGAILIVLVVVAVVLRRRAPRVSTKRTAVLGYGVFGGFTTMVANAGGPVMSLYFLAARFEVRSFLGTAAWFFAIVNAAKLPVVIGLGLITPPLLWLDLFLVPAVIAGGLVGRAIVGRLPQRAFERIVLILTAATAIFLLLGPI